MPSKEEILEYVTKNNIEFIRLWFTDLNGILKGFAITEDELENALNRGMMVQALPVFRILKNQT